MKNLSLGNVQIHLQNSDNILFSNSIKNFINDLAFELLVCNKVDPNIEFNFDINDLSHQSQIDYQFEIGLTDGIYLTIDSKIYNGFDSVIEVEKIIMSFPDDTNFKIDLSKNSDIVNYIQNNIIL